MDLYLIRHADALALGEHGVNTDAERPLSEQGESQARQVAKALQKRGIVLDKLLTSPLVRARQTADLMLRSWNGTAPELVVCDDLVPDAKPRKLARFLRKAGGEKIGLVGHLPHIAIMAAWLIGYKKAQIELAKAGVAHVACANGLKKGMGSLEWLVTPAWFE
ncbi:MAG: phosphohistidine phosphatase SixA [Gemmataceae bacterium]|nr:phosphohistidine phosphatase SixA [Gemmataceae bacterium]MCI0740260.1 phosphohistidine phosphatase SixA [Gemmataceae bacterium]